MPMSLRIAIAVTWAQSAFLLLLSGRSAGFAALAVVTAIVGGLLLGGGTVARCLAVVLEVSLMVLLVRGPHSGVALGWAAASAAFVVTAVVTTWRVPRPSTGGR